MSNPFVLVHGASHGRWCFEEVIALLADRGRRAYALDLPGHGERASEAAGVRLPDYVHAVTQFIEEHDLRQVNLLGHSMGGAVIQKVAEHAPARLAHLIFLAAYVLADGESIIGLVTPEFRRQWETLAAASGDQTVSVPFEVVAPRWMNRCTNDQLARALPKLTPQPWLPVCEPIKTKTLANFALPVTYIICRYDQGMTPQRCQSFANRVPNCTVRTIDGDHDVMISNPAALVETLLVLP